MLWYIVIAGVFSVLTVVALLLDGVFDALVPDLGEGLLSSTSLAAAVAGGGYGGWIAQGGFGASASAALVAAVATGVAVLLITGIAVRVVRRAETPQARLVDAVGEIGSAITGAPAGRPFEFSVHHAGQPMKISAIADHEVAQGDALVIDQVISPTRLHVVPHGPEECVEAEATPESDQ